MAIVVIEEVSSKPHDVMTVKQFASKANVSEANVLNMTRKLDPSGEATMLDRCYPYGGDDEGDLGPLFIPLNKKGADYLKKREGKNKRINGKRNT
jgi:hypothetical protein